jgi:hypothetical protein
MTSVFELSINTKESVRQLRAGHRWLTEQHRLWLAGDRLDGDDSKFSRILDDWGLLEQVLRRAGFGGCIWAPGGRCPADAPVICDGCTQSAQSEAVVPLGLESVAQSTRANVV